MIEGDLENNLGGENCDSSFRGFRPCGVRNGATVNFGGTQDEMSEYARVAKEDWSTFLLHRATELRAGVFNCHSEET